MRASIVAVFLLMLASACRPAESQPSAKGKAVFESVCARCHGREGHGGAAVGNAPAPRNFADATFQRTRTDAQLREAIVKGRSNGAMPAFGTTFTDEELDALVAQIRFLGAGEEGR